MSTAGTSIFFCMTGALMRLPLLVFIGAFMGSQSFAKSASAAFTGKITEIQSDLPALHSEYQTLTVRVDKVIRGKPVAVMNVKVMRRQPGGKVSPDYHIGETVRCHQTGNDNFLCIEQR